MVVEFCRKMTDRGHPVACHVFHRGPKIHEFKPQVGKAFSTVSFQIFGDHAYHYKSGGTNQIASQAQESTTRWNELSGFSVRQPFQHNQIPAFGEWETETQFQEQLWQNFEGLRDEAKSKKRPRGADRKRDFRMYWTTQIDEAEVYIRERQDELRGTEDCFEIQPMFGNDAEKLVELRITARGCPQIRLKEVCEDAWFLNALCERNKWGITYRGESHAAFGENLRIALFKRRQDPSQAMKKTILERFVV